MELLLIRHAKAEPPRAGLADAERALVPRGRERAERLGRHLKENDLLPDLILASPKVRARETAEILHQALALLPSALGAEERLADRFDLEALQEILNERPVTRLALVGHDPDISLVAGDLCGREFAMDTGEMVRLRLPDDRRARPGSATLLERTRG